MLGWFYYTVKIRLGRKVRRAMWCSIWFSEFSPKSPSPITHTPLGQLSWRLFLLVLRGCKQTGYWSAGLLSELKMFIMLSALSTEPPSLMDRSMVLPCTCPCHPHTLSTIDPHVTRPCPAAASLGGGMFLLRCQHWNMFLISVALLMSVFSVLSHSDQWYSISLL